jgi:hypothetical protein
VADLVVALVDSLSDRSPGNTELAQWIEQRYETAYREKNHKRIRTIIHQIVQIGKLKFDTCSPVGDAGGTGFVERLTGGGFGGAGRRRHHSGAGRHMLGATE